MQLFGPRVQTYYYQRCRYIPVNCGWQRFQFPARTGSPVHRQDSGGRRTYMCRRPWSWLTVSVDGRLRRRTGRRSAGTGSILVEVCLYGCTYEYNTCRTGVRALSLRYFNNTKIRFIVVLNKYANCDFFLFIFFIICIFTRNTQFNSRYTIIILCRVYIYIVI